eukprot:scaffold19903_cov64-Phaeocystis_antarctica.AAC.10
MSASSGVGNVSSGRVTTTASNSTASPLSRNTVGFCPLPAAAPVTFATREFSRIVAPTLANRFWNAGPKPPFTCSGAAREPKLSKPANQV